MFGREKGGNQGVGCRMQDVRIRKSVYDRGYDRIG